jgi:hypothetical protein
VGLSPGVLTSNGTFPGAVTSWCRALALGAAIAARHHSDRHRAVDACRQQT